jgi:cold shock CspA family protein
MEVPLHLDIQNFAPEAFVREEVEKQVEALEKRFKRITACRVAIKGPSGHHQTGGLYEVNIWITLPDGREVAVIKTPTRDERHSHLIFAIHDAFKRARRRLEDTVRKMDLRTKTHETPPHGTVTHLSADGEFGFLTTDDGREIYFHRNSVLNGGYKQLHHGDKVSFSEEQGLKGAQASTVHILQNHRAAP